MSEKVLMQKNGTFKRSLQTNTAITIIFSAALLVLGQIVSPGFADVTNIMNLLTISAFLGILALSQTIVMVVDSGGIDLSVGSTLQFSMILIAGICADGNVNMWVGIIVGVGACFLFGLANGAGIVLLKIPPLIMTMAMSSIIIGVMLIYTGGFPNGMAPQPIARFIYSEWLGIPNMVWVWILIIGIVTFIATKTKLGKMLYGVGANRTTAELSGVNTKKARIFSYAVAAMVSGITGVFLLGYMSAPNNLETGTGYVMPSIAAAVVGGISLSGGEGSYGGVVAGVIFLTILEALLMTIQMGEPFRKIIYGIVVVIILINYALKARKSR